MPIINTVTGGGGSGKGKVIDGEVTPQSFPASYPAPDGFVGWAKLTVNAPENLSEENIRKDVTIAGVTGIYDPQPNLQDKTLKPASFPSTVTHDEGYGGLGTVTVESPDNLSEGNIRLGVNIAGVVGTYDPQPNLQSVTKTPAEFPLSITPSEGYDGLSDVTVNAPAGLRPENIPEGVTIAGVEGTYVGPTVYSDDLDMEQLSPMNTTTGTAYAGARFYGIADVNVTNASARYFDVTILAKEAPTGVTSYTFSERILEPVYHGKRYFINTVDAPVTSTYVPGSSYNWLKYSLTIPAGEHYIIPYASSGYTHIKGDFFVWPTLSSNLSYQSYIYLNSLTLPIVHVDSDLMTGEKGKKYFPVTLNEDFALTSWNYTYSSGDPTTLSSYLSLIPWKVVYS